MDNLKQIKDPALDLPDDVRNSLKQAEKNIGDYYWYWTHVLIQNEARKIRAEIRYIGFNPVGLRRELILDEHGNQLSES